MREARQGLAYKIEEQQAHLQMQVSDSQRKVPSIPHRLQRKTLARLRWQSTVDNLGGQTLPRQHQTSALVVASSMGKAMNGADIHTDLV